MTTVESIRMILLLALVFLVSLYGAGILGAPVITILAYLVLQYRRKIKSLEGRLADTGHASTVSEMPPRSESQLPPSSTDA
jgi:hypothetical protein